MFTLPSFIFAIVMGFIMALILTFVATWYRSGMPADFLVQWLSLFMVIYPVAVIGTMIFKPLAAKFAGFILANLHRDTGEQ